VVLQGGSRWWMDTHRPPLSVRRVLVSWYGGSYLLRYLCTESNWRREWSTRSCGHAVLRSLATNGHLECRCRHHPRPYLHQHCEPVHPPSRYFHACANEERLGGRRLGGRGRYVWVRHDRLWLHLPRRLGLERTDHARRALYRSRGRRRPDGSAHGGQGRAHAHCACLNVIVCPYVRSAVLVQPARPLFFSSRPDITVP